VKYKDTGIKKGQGSFNKFFHKTRSVCREFTIQDLKIRFYDAFRYTATDRIDGQT